MWKQFEQQLWDVWGMFGRITVGVGHLNHKFDMVTIIEEDFDYLQLLTPVAGGLIIKVIVSREHGGVKQAATNCL